MSDARKALRDWQLDNLHSGPFAMPQYDDFTRIVEGIERDSDRIEALEAEIRKLKESILPTMRQAYLDNAEARHRQVEKALEAENERLREFFDAFEERVAAYMEGTNEARISLSQKRFREAQDAVRAALNAKEEG